MCWTCGFSGEHAHSQLSNPVYRGMRAALLLSERDVFRLYPAWARRVRAAMSEIVCVRCGAGKYQELDGIAWLGFAANHMESRWRCGCGGEWEQ